MVSKKQLQTPKDKGLNLWLVASAAIIVAIVTGFLFYRKNLEQRYTAYRAYMYQYLNRPKVVMLDLAEQNSSGETGKVTLKEVGGKVVVNILLDDYPKGVRQPAHIHQGTCAYPRDVKYPLTEVVSGKSETKLGLGMKDLFQGVQMYVNVHKSQAQMATSVACVDLPLNY